MFIYLFRESFRRAWQQWLRTVKTFYLSNKISICQDWTRDYRTKLKMAQVFISPPQTGQPRYITMSERHRTQIWQSWSYCRFTWGPLQHPEEYIDWISRVGDLPYIFRRYFYYNRRVPWITFIINSALLYNYTAVEAKQGIQAMRYGMLTSFYHQDGLKAQVLLRIDLIIYLKWQS